MRKQLKAENISVSINDFVIKAVAVALQQVPEMNALFSNDKVSITFLSNESTGYYIIFFLLKQIVAGFSFQHCRYFSGCGNP